MTTINTQTPIVGIDGKPMLIANDVDAEPLVLGRVLVEALLAPLPGDEKLSHIRRLEIFRLALRIQEGTTIELTAKDVVTLQERLPQTVFTTVVVARALESIEPNTVS